MRKGNACVEKGDEEDSHNSVLDDPFFLVFCKHQNGCCKDENHDQFKTNVA